MAARSNASSACLSYAVTNTMVGMSAGPMVRTTSSPVMPGICTSRNTRSGASDRIASTAETPSPIMPTISTPGSFRTKAATRRRPSGSSSTISTRSGGCSGIACAPALGRGVMGKATLRDSAAALIRVQRKSLARSIQLREASARIRQTYAFTHWVRRPAAVVAHREHQVAIVAHGVHSHAPDGLHLRQPVPKRVFDERLEHEIRDEGAVERRVGLDGHLQLSLKAHFHDVEIPTQHLELTSEGDLLVVALAEGVAEEIAEPRDHAARAGRVLFHERRDGVQRIEQKVWVELRAQCVEPRVGNLRMELRCFRTKLRGLGLEPPDRKSTRLNSSHRCISYAVFCLKKKKKQ